MAQERLIAIYVVAQDYVAFVMEKERAMHVKTALSIAVDVKGVLSVQLVMAIPFVLYAMVTLCAQSVEVMDIAHFVPTEMENARHVRG